MPCKPSGGTVSSLVPYDGVKTMSDDKLTPKEALDVAWKYFQQHAHQRIAFFNFFVIFQALMTSGLLATFRPEFGPHVIGVGIGVMQTFIAYVFWKVDQRNKFLTKHGELALIELEKLYAFVPDDSPEPSPVQIFTSEVVRTAAVKERVKDERFWKRQKSHSKSFNLLFVVFAFVGLSGALSSGLYHFVFHPPEVASAVSDTAAEGRVTVNGRAEVVAGSATINISRERAERPADQRSTAASQPEAEPSKVDSASTTTRGSDALVIP